MTAIDPRADLTLREMATREAEERLGRNLTDGELHLDIIGWGRDLDEGKEQLADAIQAEIHRAIVALVTGRGIDQLKITPAMEDALIDLYEKGVAHARREAESMGVRAFADDDEEDEPRGIHGIMDYVARRQAQGQPVADKFLRLVPFLSTLYGMLRTIEERMRKEALGFDLGAMAQARLVEIIERKVPGALDAAGRIVSGAMTSGLGATWEEVGADLAWQYSAVMDANTCVVCRLQDGRTFETLAAALQVLPNFGPNPLCHGDGRCRCRLVPAPPSGIGEPPTRRRPPGQHTVADLANAKTARIDQPALGTRLEDESANALADIDKAIGGPLTWDSPTVQFDIRWGDVDMKENTVATYTGTIRGMYPPLVQVHPVRGRERGPVGMRADLIHEIGHYLDVDYFGRGYQVPFAPNTYGGSMTSVYGPDFFGDYPEGMARAREEMHELMELLHKSPSIRGLVDVANGYFVPEKARGLPDPAFMAQYLMRPREMFARAFTQYVAWSSEDQELLNSVRATGRIYADLGMPWYWSDEEFFDIALAFDRLFQKARELP